MKLDFATAITRVHRRANRVRCDCDERDGSMQRVGKAQGDSIAALDTSGSQRLAHGEHDPIKSGVIEEWPIRTSEGGTGRMLGAVDCNELKQVGHQGIRLMWRARLGAAATTIGMVSGAPFKSDCHGTTNRHYAPSMAVTKTADAAAAAAAAAPRSAEEDLTAQYPKLRLAIRAIDITGIRYCASGPVGVPQN